MYVYIYIYIYIHIRKCIYDSGWARVPASAGRGPTQNETKEMMKNGCRDSGWARVPRSAGHGTTQNEPPIGKLPQILTMRPRLIPWQTQMALFL